MSIPPICLTDVLRVGAATVNGQETGLEIGEETGQETGEPANREAGQEPA
jgi:hypothetical protein